MKYVICKKSIGSEYGWFYAFEGALIKFCIKKNDAFNFTSMVDAVHISELLNEGDRDCHYFVEGISEEV